MSNIGGNRGRRSSSRGSRSSRSAEHGKGFTPAQEEDMLDVIEEILPVGGEEWTLVKFKHDKKWGFMNRKEDGLRRKCSTLYRNKAPTGNPIIPNTVQRAQDIRQSIRDKADMGEGDVGNLEMSDDGEIQDDLLVYISISLLPKNLQLFQLLLIHVLSLLSARDVNVVKTTVVLSI